MVVTRNGAFKKIILGVVTILLASLITQVLASASRISVLESQVAGIKETITQGRVENREDHQRIEDKLDAIIFKLNK